MATRTIKIGLSDTDKSNMASAVTTNATAAVLEALLDEYSPGNTYKVGDVVLHGGKIYKCVVAVDYPQPWSSSSWVEANLSDVIERIDTSLNSLGQTLRYMGETEFNGLYNEAYWILPLSSTGTLITQLVSTLSWASFLELIGMSGSEKTSFIVRVNYAAKDDDEWYARTYIVKETGRTLAGHISYYAVANRIIPETKLFYTEKGIHTVTFDVDENTEVNVVTKVESAPFELVSDDTDLSQIQSTLAQKADKSDFGSFMYYFRNYYFSKLDTGHEFFLGSEWNEYMLDAAGLYYSAPSGQASPKTWAELCEALSFTPSDNSKEFFIAWIINGDTTSSHLHAVKPYLIHVTTQTVNGITTTVPVKTDVSNVTFIYTESGIYKTTFSEEKGITDGAFNSLPFVDSTTTSPFIELISDDTDLSQIQSALSAKANSSDVSAALALKADKSELKDCVYSLYGFTFCKTKYWFMSKSKFEAYSAGNYDWDDFISDIGETNASQQYMVYFVGFAYGEPQGAYSTKPYLVRKALNPVAGIGGSNSYLVSLVDISDTSLFFDGQNVYMKSTAFVNGGIGEGVDVSSSNNAPLDVVADETDLSSINSSLAQKANRSSIFPTYSATSTYSVGDIVWYESGAWGLYRCNTAISTAEAWTPSHWTAINLNQELSAIRTLVGTKANSSDVLPKSSLVSDYQSNASYSKGAVVYYNGSLYKATTQTTTGTLPTSGTEWEDFSLGDFGVELDAITDALCSTSIRVDCTLGDLASFMMSDTGYACADTSAVSCNSSKSVLAHVNIYVADTDNDSTDVYDGFAIMVANGPNEAVYKGGGCLPASGFGHVFFTFYIEVDFSSNTGNCLLFTINNPLAGAKANALVPVYDITLSTNYSVGDVVLWDGKMWKCIQAFSAGSLYAPESGSSYWSQTSLSSYVDDKISAAIGTAIGGTY